MTLLVIRHYSDNNQHQDIKSTSPKGWGPKTGSNIGSQTVESDHKAIVESSRDADAVAQLHDASQRPHATNSSSLTSDSASASSSHVPILPEFTADGKDYVFSAIIERTFDSYGPYVTTFFLSHHMMEAFLLNGVGVERASPKTRSIWKQASKKFQSLEYDNAGRRSSKLSYTCKISHSDRDVWYEVPAKFLPNRLATDVNSNRRLDILRCPIQDAVNATEFFQRTDHELRLEILCDRISLISFTIPWRSRRTGYMLDSLPGASNIDAWKSKDLATSDAHDVPIVHLSMPGSRLLPTKKNIALILEYVAHHLNIGFDHIYFTTALPWDSDEMSHLLQVVKSFVLEGKLTITSSSGDSILAISSTGGLQWHPVAIKTYQSSMMLFYTKGFADYLAVFDIDEFFIPRGVHSSITDVIKAIDYPNGHVPIRPGKAVAGSKGIADSHAHPLCFISVKAEVVARTEHESANQSPWLGLRFSHGSEHNDHGDKQMRFAYTKAIYPTRRVYQAGKMLNRMIIRSL